MKTNSINKNKLNMEYKKQLEEKLQLTKNAKKSDFINI